MCYFVERCVSKTYQQIGLECYSSMYYVDYLEGEKQYDIQLC
jgi:hypothetical protein